MVVVDEWWIVAGSNGYGYGTTKSTNARGTKGGKGKRLLMWKGKEAPGSEGKELAIRGTSRSTINPASFSFPKTCGSLTFQGALDQGLIWDLYIDGVFYPNCNGK